jgi:hypothetical protein
MCGVYPVRLICVGQSGIGYYAVLPAMPARDEGASTESVGAMLICDAAIVSRSLHGNYQIDLVTNSLGPNIAERQALLAKLSEGVEIHEPLRAAEHLPFDFILIETNASSRTYITSEYYPSRSHIEESIGAILHNCDSEDNLVFYFDVEYDTPGGAEARAVLTRDVAVSDSSCLFNIGHVHSWNDFIEWTAGFSSRFSGHLVFQVSFRGSESDLRPSILASVIRAFATHMNRVSIVITRGGLGALLVRHNGVSNFDCEAVSDAFTVGAGAIFSATLVDGLISRRWARSPRSVMVDCVISAQEFVVRATEAKSLGLLSFW